MKKIFTLLFCLVLSFPLVLQAQEENKKQLWYCYVETVNPLLIEPYREMSVELAELAKSNHFPFAFFVWADHDLNYYIWYPINELNDIDVIDKEWDKLMMQWGEEKSKSFRETKKSNYSFTMTARNDLFYLPETPRPEVKDPEFIYWQNFYLVPGKTKDIEKVILEANKILADNNYDDPWYIGEAGIGMNVPCLVAWSYGKDQMDYLSQDKKFGEQLGELFKPLLPRFNECLKGIESKELFYAKKFSYEKEN